MARRLFVMRYVYFVNYQYTRGYGNAEVPFSAPITTIEHVREVARAVAQSLGWATSSEGVVVTNFILIRTEESHE